MMKAKAFKKKVLAAALALAAGGSPAAARGFSFDSPSALPALPEAPLAPAAPAAVRHPAQPLFGEYRLEETAAGFCREGLEIVEEEFANAPLGGNIGVYGLPRGQGLVVEQVLELNAGLRFDRYENPMVILPFQSGFLGYRPRQADFDGERLVYRTGELARLKPLRISRGEILQLVIREDRLELSQGAFEEKKVSFSNVCRYRRVSPRPGDRGAGALNSAAARALRTVAASPDSPFGPLDGGNLGVSAYRLGPDAALRTARLAREAFPGLAWGPAHYAEGGAQLILVITSEDEPWVYLYEQQPAGGSLSFIGGFNAVDAVDAVYEDPALEPLTGGPREELAWAGVLNALAGERSAAPISLGRGSGPVLWWAENSD